jgi:hypothetical protein
MSREAAALVCLCLISDFAEAQSGATVRGRVVARDSVPLPGALIELVATGDSTRSAVTGEFVLPGAPVGKQTLRIRALGYKITLEEILVASGTGWTGTIVLETAPAVLPDVAVTAAFDKPEAYAHTAKYDDFFRRRKLGIGTFRTREEIEAKAAYDIVSVLQGIPSVGVSKTHNFNSETEVRFRLPRCTPPRVGFYIDGRKVGNFLNEPKERSGIKSVCEDCVRLAEALESLHLRDIEFVEFYRGPSQVPPELDRGDSCAALVVWTR